MVPESGIKHRNDAGTAGRNHNQTLEEKLPPHRIKLLSWIICTKEGKRECQYHLIVLLFTAAAAQTLYFLRMKPPVNPRI